MKNSDDASHQQASFVVENQVHVRRKLQTAMRARSRKSALVSPGSSRIGEPTVMLPSSGTGRISPLGRMRFRFSR